MDPKIVEKFYGLLTYLTYTKTEFELVADEIEDCKLKTALNGLSEESDQYKNELCLELKALGFQYQSPNALVNVEEVNSNISSECFEKGNELQLICSCSESYITRAYRDILNEYFPFPAIRQIMIYQLNTLKSAFMKVNLLNSARFAN